MWGPKGLRDEMGGVEKESPLRNIGCGVQRACVIKWEESRRKVRSCNMGYGVIVGCNAVASKQRSCTSVLLFANLALKKVGPDGLTKYMIPSTTKSNLPLIRTTTCCRLLVLLSNSKRHSGSRRRNSAHNMECWLGASSCVG